MLKSTSSSTVLKFTDLPVEVVEKICSFLDGKSVESSRHVSSTVRNLVDEALSGITGWKFWRNRSFLELSPGFLAKVLGSFRTVLEERNRRCLYPLDTDLESLTQYSWRDVYLAVYRFQDKCSKGLLVVEDLRIVEKGLKNEVMMIFRGKARLGYPFRTETTSGSLLLQLRCPCSSKPMQDHLFVFEDMRYLRRGAQVVCSKEKVLGMKIMSMPIGIFSSHSAEPVLPKVSTICLIVTTNYLAVVPCHEGAVRRIPLSLSPIHRGLIPKIPRENQFAVWGEYIGVWADPVTICIYRISICPARGDVGLDLVKVIEMDGIAEEYWRKMAASPMNYMPVLHKGFFDPLIASQDQIPSFALLSPISSYFNISSSPQRTTLNHYVPMSTPKQRADCVREFGRCIGHSYEHSVYIFWSSIAIAIHFTRDIWIYQFLNSLFGEQDEELVGVETLREDFLLLASNSYFYFAILNFTPPEMIDKEGDYWTRGRVDFRIIRKIRIRDYFPNPLLQLNSFHFDFDRGKPYIFLVLDLPDSTRTPYSYQLKKLKFQDSEEEVEEAFGCLKVQDDWTTVQIQEARTEVNLRLRSTDPRIEAFFQTILHPFSSHVDLSTQN